MKNKIILLLAAFAVAIFAFVGCEKNPTNDIPQKVLTFIDSHYPGAVILDADNDTYGIEAKSGATSIDYYDVDIMHQNTFKEVSFTRGVYDWVETTWEIRPSELPSPVMASLNKFYPNYTIESCEYVENSVKDYYDIELERYGDDKDVKIYADGTLASNPNFNIIPEQIRTFINTKYPNSIILSFDSNADSPQKEFEVDILHENLQKDVIFEKDTYKWVCTYWDISPLELPAAVVTSIRTKYPNHKIDDCEYVENEKGYFYVVEIDGLPDLSLSVNPDGTIKEILNNLK